MDEKQKTLTELFESWANEKLIDYSPLPPSGSYREYYRLQGQSKKVLGVYNQDLKENEAFFHFTEQFLSNKLNVPRIYYIHTDKSFYLIEDLGNTTLYDLIAEQQKSNTFNRDLINYYKQVIKNLPLFQIQAGNALDYNYCYPRKAFDKQSMMWDLSYFKYYFLKLAKIPFDEQLLENDYHIFTDFLLNTDCNYFLYRDFQSRNILIHNGKTYFIDYQGGRRGALQYDLASLLYDAKADIPHEVRIELLNDYINEVNKYIPVDEKEFKDYYFGYVLIRILQAMGAYGFRGFYEKKTHFLQSIPYALSNLRYLLDQVTFPVKIPTLLSILDHLTNSEKLKKIGISKTQESKRLTVSLYSFSYKQGISFKDNPHGGGFIFDCRALPNPGRLEQYKTLSGLNREVIHYLENEHEVADFLSGVTQIVDQSVENYISRDFEHLSVGFGCTGGQHRSVYCTEQLKKHLQSRFEINVQIEHKGKNNWLK